MAEFKIYTMKKGLIAILLLCSTSLLVAQVDEAAIQKEIDEQLWKPFIESWGNFDAEKFNDLHTDDVLRASAWSLRIGSEYKDRNKERFAQNLADKRKRSIQFWFEHRKTNPTLSYEVGYYKVIASKPGEDESYHYARFHVVIKKVDGKWKIAQDWDTNNINGVAVTEADFAKAKGPILQ